MLKVFIVLAVILILTMPALADANQKAKIAGDNVMDIKVKQTAWNYGSGSIKQDIDVLATGNVQKLSQDSQVLISDSDYDGNINNGGWAIYGTGDIIYMDTQFPFNSITVNDIRMSI